MHVLIGKYLIICYLKIIGLLRKVFDTVIAKTIDKASFT